MSTFNNNSIDSIATDSPYGISFMNRSWDKFTPKSFENFSYKWGLKAIEILKPGSYLINFSHPRRYHRMVCGLEDAGFFIKDMILWVNGQGFPKNDNYLKPSIEPIVLSQKPYKGSVKDNLEKWRVGKLNIDDCRIPIIKGEKTGFRPNCYDKNYKTKSILGDFGERIGRKVGKQNEKGRYPSNFILSHHPECKLIGIKNVKTSTLLKTHKHSPKYDNFYSSPKNKREIKKDYGKNGYDIIENYECHPDCPIRILDKQTGYLHPSYIDKSKGSKKLNEKKEVKNNESYTSLDGKKPVSSFYSDKGTASRYFYKSKVHKKERNAGCEDLFWKINNNQTFSLISKNEFNLLPNDKRIMGNPIVSLKPINLMRYLIKLITPENGIVLDPFSGSGTTAIACIIESFKYILIEKRENFANIVIPKRIEYWKNPKNWNILKDHNSLTKIKDLQENKLNKQKEMF